MGDFALSQHEAELIASLRAGSTPAFEYLMRQYYPELHAYVTRWLRSSTAADDILQETFLRLWTHRASLEVHTTLRAYLYAATRGHILMHQRQDRHYNRYLDHDTLAFNVPNEANPLHDLLTADLTMALRAAVETMPLRTREVFTLSREQGLTYGEIAEVMGISVNTVKTQLGRALGVLRQAAAPFLGMLLFIQA